ncbi:hypothetical protein D3C81_1819390 [compost metagenome]
MPSLPDTSISPTMPAVVLMTNRPSVLTERWALPCSRSLMNTLGSPKFATKLWTPAWNISGSLR